MMMAAADVVSDDDGLGDDADGHDEDDDGTFG